MAHPAAAAVSAEDLACLEATEESRVRLAYIVRRTGSFILRQATDIRRTSGLF
jgi:hypothetical protein